MSKATTCIILVSGRVQGVFFRARTLEKARDLALTGSVRNLPDGRVRIEACGTAEALDGLIAWCRKGPPMAQVETVELIYDGPLVTGSDFIILR